MELPVEVYLGHNDTLDAVLPDSRVEEKRPAVYTRREEYLDLGNTSIGANGGSYSNILAREELEIYNRMKAGVLKEKECS